MQVVLARRGEDNTQFTCFTRIVQSGLNAVFICLGIYFTYRFALGIVHHPFGICLTFFAKREYNACVSCHVDDDLIVIPECPAVCTIMEITCSRGVDGLVIFYVESLICKVIGLYRSFRSALKRRDMGLDGHITVDHITHFRLLVIGIEPSTEHFGFRERSEVCDVIRDLLQGCTFVRIYSTQLLASLVFEDDLARSDFASLSLEIVTILNRTESQHIRLTQIIVGEDVFFVGIIILIASGCRIVQGSDDFSLAVLHFDRLVAVLAVADRKFHRSIHRYSNRKTAIAVLVIIERTACCYAFRQRCEVILFAHVAHDHLKVHKRAGYVLHKLDLLQHTFAGSARTINVNIRLLGSQFNDLRREFTDHRCFCNLGLRRRCRTFPCPYA